MLKLRTTLTSCSYEVQWVLNTVIIDVVLSFLEHSQCSCEFAVVHQATLAHSFGIVVIIYITI